MATIKIKTYVKEKIGAIGYTWELQKNQPSYPWVEYIKQAMETGGLKQIVVVTSPWEDEWKFEK